MRIINKETKKVYTDLAELLRDEKGFLYTNNVRLVYGDGWHIDYWLRFSGPHNFPLPPDRFTVCPDDCVTKEEMWAMAKEIWTSLDASQWEYNVQCLSEKRLYEIISKYLGEQQP